MEPNKDASSETPSNSPEESLNNSQNTSASQAPADALSRTPDELEEERQKEGIPDPSAALPEKKLPLFKRIFRKVNVYFLGFILLVVIAGAIAVVNYLNSQKTPPSADIASQTLTQSALSQLANTNTSVGSSSQTLTIQGNTVINGQTLARGQLQVAGNFQTGGSVTAPNITVSGTSNLGTAQINSLQVAGTTALQGTTTVASINVAGTSSFSGAMTASQITVTNLVLSGNATLQAPNHISFTGPSPVRTSLGSAVGNGGSASINGSDTTGTININTGGNTAVGCFISVNFSQPFSQQAHVIISPVDPGAGATQYYVTRSNTGFSVCDDTPAPANQVFAFDYFVTN